MSEYCPTKVTLLTASHKAAENYSEAVAEVTRQIGIVPKTEYESLCTSAEEARSRAVEAEATLQAHINEHGCHHADGGEVAA